MSDEPQPPNPDVTKAYRNGIVEGVRLILAEIQGAIPEEQGRAIAKWADGPLQDWAERNDASPPPPTPLTYGA